MKWPFFKGARNPTSEGARQLCPFPLAGSKRCTCFCLMSVNHTAPCHQSGPSPSVQASGQTQVTDGLNPTGSTPPGVDPIFMAGAHAAIIGCQEQDERG